jgi:hypothetical protein
MSEKSKDMVLVVTVTVSGTIDSDNKMICSAKYAMASSVPPTSSGSVVVEPNGNIDLNALNKTSGFTEGTDIYFMLEGTVDGPKGAVPVFFKTPADKAAKITGPKGKKCGITRHLPGTRNATMLLLDDFDTAGYTYDYALNLVAYADPEAKAAHGVLDPGIVDRGGG